MDTFSFTAIRIVLKRRKVRYTFPGSARLRGVGHFVVLGHASLIPLSFFDVLLCTWDCHFDVFALCIIFQGKPFPRQSLITERVTLRCPTSPTGHPPHQGLTHLTFSPRGVGPPRGRHYSDSIYLTPGIQFVNHPSSRPRPPYVPSRATLSFTSFRSNVTLM